MKKLLVFLALLFATPVYAQTAGQFYSVPTVTALAALTTRPPQVYAFGNTSSTDLLGATYDWVLGSAVSADGFNVVAPSGGGAAGRWFRQTSSGTPVANGVLVTNGSKVPSINTTLPNGLAMGTPSSLTLTNAINLPSASLLTPSDLNITATGATASISLANRAANDLSPMDFGCVGDGVANDTTCMQAAITAAAGKQLFLGPYLYKVGALTDAGGTVTIIGSQAPAGIYVTTCTSGFLAASANTTLLTLTANNSRVSSVCFQMGASFNSNSSGTAIVLGVATNQVVDHSQINFPFIGIDITGSGASQNANAEISGNVIIQTSNLGAAVRIGKNSTAAGTVDARILNNNILNYSSNTATGLLVMDSGGAIFRGNDPFQMGTGLKIYPGAGQFVDALFYYDVMGDSSYVNDVLIDTADATASIRWLNFIGAWSSSGLTNSILIQNTASAALTDISFVGLQIPMHAGSIGTGLNIVAGSQISVRDSVLCGQGSLPSATGIAIGAAASNIQITGTRFSGCPGNIGTAISVAGGANYLTIVGNDLRNTTTPLSYAPNNELAVITNNMGLDNTSPTIASASTISLPNSPTVFVSGGTTVTAITGKWQARSVTIIALTAGGFSATGGVCGASGGTPYAFPYLQAINLLWINGTSCWVATASGFDVSSVSNNDGTLTISPTAGAVIASLALGHANTWSGQQTFVAPILGTPASATLTNATGYPGDNNLVTTGTITTGTWRGSPVAGLYGGTGLSSAAIGDIIYASATTPIWSRLADVAVGSMLISGGVNTAPTWSATPTLGASGTVGTLALGNATSGTVTLAAVSGALGSVTASLPANSGVIAELNLSQTWTANQFYTSIVQLTASSAGGGKFLFSDTNTGGKTWQLGPGALSGSASEWNFANQTDSVIALHIGSNGNILSGGTVTSTGHLLSSGTTPTISSCGTGTPSISGSDNFGSVVAGTVATSCVINFGATWGAIPSCSVSSSTAISSLTVTSSTTQLTIAGTALGGDTIKWVCGSTAMLNVPQSIFAINDNLLDFDDRKKAA